CVSVNCWRVAAACPAALLGRKKAELKSVGRRWAALPIVGLLILVTGRAEASMQDVQTVFIILEENHSWASIKGSALAPYINNTLLPMASYAEQYYTPPGVGPSLPNYL